MAGVMGCKCVEHGWSLCRRQNVMCILIWTISTLALVHCSVTGVDMNCASVRYTYQEKGITPGQVPKDPLRGEHLRICSQELTCCTQEMEHQLSTHSRMEFDRAVRDSLEKPGSMLRVRARKFDDFFKTLLTTSKREFHDMFKKTYGIIYEQNSYVFTDLYEELERYYAKGQVDLAEALDNFFNTLYQKMFTVLNAQYRFDDTYLRCVGEHMSALKPFGDVPAKLSVQLRRAFVATRTFAQALSKASDVVSNMAKIPPSPECLRALTKMSGCPACTGLPELKACNNYCINVMKGCLAHHTELNTEWNNFIDALDKVIDRLEGPFNIEIVVNPINIKISEAIMNFQENGQDVSQKVFQGCGKPQLGRRRRRDTTELDFEVGQFHDAPEGDGTTLESLVGDVRIKVNDTRNFWTNLPYQICNDDQVAASPAKDDSCWNGEKKARYLLQITKDGFTNQRGNPEVNVDVNRESSLLNEQVFLLRTLTSQLKNAYIGRDVEWIDNEDSSYGSGSGSGDGGSDDSDENIEGSGGNGDYSSGRGQGGSGKHKPDNNNMDNNLYIHHGPNGTAGGPSAKLPRVSVNRALATYLLPIVVMWFGGLFSEWL
ncbi:glypican-6 [Anabrus simplex]|uniref:glypican-6 n=1 Tax=Anabrus simplex TaxID=316456 RepID=UPI0034DD8443